MNMSYNDIKIILQIYCTMLSAAVYLMGGMLKSNEAGFLMKVNMLQWCMLARR